MSEQTLIFNNVYIIYIGYVIYIRLLCTHTVHLSYVYIYVYITRVLMYMSGPDFFPRSVASYVVS